MVLTSKNKQGRQDTYSRLQLSSKAAHIAFVVVVVIIVVVVVIVVRLTVVVLVGIFRCGIPVRTSEPCPRQKRAHGGPGTCSLSPGDGDGQAEEGIPPCILISTVFLKLGLDHSY
jgi:hypothetical protein